MNVPSRQKARDLLSWAADGNPGAWFNHSLTVARAAETIACHAALDADAAYAMGALHDVGRYEGVRGLHHVYAGYMLMQEQGYTDIARVCLSHSFPYQELNAFGGGAFDCTDEEVALIAEAVRTAQYDDYDRLIQLCDALALPDRVCIVESRLVDVALRHGFDDCTLEKWRHVYAIKALFDEKCAGNIYSLFKDEICATVFS